MTAQHEEVTVLWNGGWDTYIVDPGQVCETPVEQFEGNRIYFPTWYEGPNSGYPCWLKGSFIRKSWARIAKSVKIIRHIDGGN